MRPIPPVVPFSLALEAAKRPAWDQRPGTLDAARIDGAPLVVGHRDGEKGWLVRMLAGGLTFDMTREDARALIEDIELQLRALNGEVGL